MRIPMALRSTAVSFWAIGCAVVLLWACTLREPGLDELLRRQLGMASSPTYISENALQPGTPGTFFPEAGVERARWWTQELAQVAHGGWGQLHARLKHAAPRLLLRSSVYRESVLAVRIPAPRADGSESLVLGATP